MTQIRDKLQIIGTAIENATEQYTRTKNSVQLLAVSKRHPIQAIQEAYQAGQTAFGENYVQELVEKAEALSELDIEWHFIGPLQSNKTKQIATIASWVHTIDRLKIAQRLNELGCVSKEGKWECSNATKVVAFCNGATCKQSPTAIKIMIAEGYPADRIYYYRGGIQSWILRWLTVTEKEGH